MRHRNYSRNVALFGLCGMLGFTIACSKTTEQPSTSKGAGQASSAPAGTEAQHVSKALVRFLNATAAPKDLKFGDLAAFDAVAARHVTPYKELPAERHEFKLYGAGDAATQLATNSEGLTSGKHYTIVAVQDKDGKADLNAINDDLVAPTNGQAKLRVINTVPGENVDVYEPNKKSALISGAGFNHATDYKDVDPSTMELMVRRGASKKGEALLRNVKLEPGRLYTVVVSGAPGRALSAETIEDQLTGTAER